MNNIPEENKKIEEPENAVDTEDVKVAENQECEENQSETQETFNTIDKQNAFSEIKENLNLIFEKAAKIEKVAAMTKDEVIQLHKLCHYEFNDRLRKAESELNRYQEIEKGRVFDGVLGEIARLYSGNITILDEIYEPKIQKRLRNMFLDLLQLLENNGISKQESKKGDKRNTKYCQVIERIPTDDPVLDDTVDESLSVGFYIENRPLIKEMVHIRVYEDKKENNKENENTAEAGCKEV